MEVIPMAILFSQVKVQSADQSETFLISGIPKEYEDLTDAETVQSLLLWNVSAECRLKRITMPTPRIKLRVGILRF